MLRAQVYQGGLGICRRIHLTDEKLVLNGNRNPILPPVGYHIYYCRQYNWRHDFETDLLRPVDHYIAGRLMVFRQHAGLCTASGRPRFLEMQLAGNSKSNMSTISAFKVIPVLTLHYCGLDAL